MTKRFLKSKTTQTLDWDWVVLFNHYFMIILRSNFSPSIFKHIFPILFLLVLGCSKKGIERPTDEFIPPPDEEELVEGEDYFLPHIDLSHWKVTLPIGNPTEVKPPEILDYATNSLLKEFMYNDSTDGSLVFYTYPGSSTQNSSYSRTELREQMVPGSNNTNWTFAQGGRIKGKLALSEVSKDNDGDYHRVIIMQIHGRLTDEQRDLIGEDDNNAPPMLKIYWENNKVVVRTKVLKDLNATDTEALHTDAWGNADKFTFSETVGFDPFTLEVLVSDGRMEVILNDNESDVYDDEHIQRWGIFENYFKAGNYLVTTDENAFSKVKYYELEHSH